MNAMTVNVEAASMPLFALRQCVSDGEWTGHVIAGPCGRGLYVVERLYDDEARFAIVHASRLAPAALTADDEYLTGDMLLAA
ncbi:hypothetical protein NKI20_02105 [Mesorhizobium sp. M0830]|uniref:hypothetical protein n=1 Tax=Mesorhizobium sp. M0830 TaxID=2957008 RepID=UPI0033389CDD